MHNSLQDAFAGLRVLSCESRRAWEMESLIRREQGDPFVAPSVQERALDDHRDALQFVERLESGEFDMVHLHDRHRPRIPA